MALAAGQSVAVNEPSNSTQSDGSSFSFHFLFSFRLIVDLDDEFWAGSIEPSNTKTNFDKERKKKRVVVAESGMDINHPPLLICLPQTIRKRGKHFAFSKRRQVLGHQSIDAKQCQRLSFNIGRAIDSNHLVRISRR